MTPEFKSKLINIAGDLSIFLAIVANLQYDFGAIAEIFPPETKKMVAASSAVAAVLLKILSRYLPAPTPDAK